MVGDDGEGDDVADVHLKPKVPLARLVLVLEETVNGPSHQQSDTHQSVH